MSAKLLYNLSDDNPNLNKQFGCMNGIFQVFYRQHSPARPVAISGHIVKSLPLGDINLESDKEQSTKKKKKKYEAKEKHRVSSESSSRLSYSSSPRSSSFSSTEVSSTTSHNENLSREHPKGCLKELVKGSINREVRGIEESHRLSYDDREMINNGYKTISKLKETPRLSLDSRSSSFKNQTEKPMSHRRSNSSVVAKLMGLEVIEDNSETEQRKENLFCDLIPTSAASKFPMESAPWKQTTVYGEIQKRLTQLEFQKSGKDLRALKQILEAMEKSISPAIKVKSESSLPKTVALPNVKVSNFRQTPILTSGKQNALDLTPRPGLYKGQLVSTKSISPKTLLSRQALAMESCRSQQHSISPRTQTKRLGLERQSRPKTPKSEPGKIQRQLGRQETESASPRRKQRIKPGSTIQQCDDRLSDASSGSRSLRSDSNISLGSNLDIEVTSKQMSPSLKPLKVNVAQLSPVSVLDAAFDEEDSPSPVRKLSLSFREDDALPSEEYEWIKKPTGFCKSMADSDLSKCFHEEGVDFKRADHKYILEILLASGLLKDIEYSMISIQLQRTRLPINPGLFLILEQNKASNMTQLEHKHRGFRQHKTNPTEKIRRKLVFDTVNEILAQKFAAEGCTKPCLISNSCKTMKKISKEEQLLQTLCSEVDRLQQNNSKCVLEDEDIIIWKDLRTQSMNFKEFKGETPGLVLDIERMIFKDLVNEVCFC